MIEERYKALAAWALKLALEKGCSAARIAVYSGMDNSFEYRNTQLDKLEQSFENGMNIQVYVDGRYSSFSTNRMDKEELKRFIRKGIESTHYLAKDEFRRLADPNRLYRGGGTDLGVVDESFPSVPVDEKLEVLRNSVNEVYGKDERLLSVSTAYSDGTNQAYMIDSNGFTGESATTYYHLSAETSLRDGKGARPSSWWYDTSIFWNLLQKKGIAEKAYRRTLPKLGQEKITSGRYKMLVDHWSISRLLSPVIASLYGSAIQQKNSFLIDRLGQTIVSDKLTIVDDPHVWGARGARWFDGEGVATKKMNVIEKGVLKTYYLDTYTASKLAMEPTIQSPSLLVMETGRRSLDEILESIDSGIWVTGFNGGNSNSTTGDFSLGIEGFLIENGKAVQPVNEMNITGNLLSLWQNIEEIGNDPQLNASWRIPSVLFKDVSFSGI